MTTKLEGLTGHIDVQIKGQEAKPRWERKIMEKALADGFGAVNELRFACRIAQDVNRAFETVELADGTSLRINPKSKAQFGRDRNGEPFLTVGVVWSEGDQSIQLKWTGETVPLKMQQVAVAHDEGRKVGSTRVRLQLANAKFTPVRKDANADGTPRVRSPRVRKEETRRREYARLCSTDLVG